MEADLQRWYQVDYRDRWAPGRRLTLRRLYVLVVHLPPESATKTVLRGKPHWAPEAHLLDELRIALTSSEKQRTKPHPDRPLQARRVDVSPERAKKLADARRRAKQRRARMAAKEV